MNSRNYFENPQGIKYISGYIYAPYIYTYMKNIIWKDERIID